MYIITISGRSGAGKSEMLRTLAALHRAPIHEGREFLRSPRVTQPPAQTFIDEMLEADMPKLRDKVRDYPYACRIYVVLSA